ncbi:MAG: hypothetical protein OEZ01_14625, partial [Candidatus Heimdallarchaeota archaeon]|nr:hypothetical protein [Candidatus Heimdallarchaeota archaeon]
LISKGAGILMNNQRKDLIVNEDIMLRTSKKGIISFNSIIKRGEELTSKLKKYEIRPHSWFDNIVIDLWKRREKFIPYEEHIPLKDEEYVEYRRDAIKYFSYERIFRENFPLSQNPVLIVEINHLNELVLKIQDETENKQIFQQFVIY